MIRLEYTIDSKTWNPISIDFKSLVEVQQFIKNAEIKDYAKKIKLLTVVKEEIIEVSK